MSNVRTEDDILASVMKCAAVVDAKPPAAATAPRPAATPSPDQAHSKWKVPGFHAKAKVFTIFGELPVEALRIRDKVRVLSGAYVEVEWIDKIKLDVDFLERHPEAQPILFKTNALGKSRPQSNVMVSPGQRVRVQGTVGEQGEQPAGSLAGKRNVMRLPHSGFTYYQFHCGSPATVSVEGMWFTVAQT